MISKSILTLLLISKVSAQDQIDLNQALWMDRSLSPEERAQALVSEMTFEEKASMTRGRGSTLPYTGHTAAIVRVGIPQINCNDGP